MTLVAKDRQIYFADEAAQAKLAEIVRYARGDLSLDKFEYVINEGRDRKDWLSGGAVHRIEHQVNNNSVKRSTLAVLAPHTYNKDLGRPYTLRELINICTQEHEHTTETRSISSQEEYQVAEQLLSVLEQMPDSELLRLIEITSRVIGRRLEEVESRKSEVGSKDNGDGG